MARLAHLFTICLAALALTAAAATGAPAKPGATTGGATNVLTQSARVSATISPNGADTTYYFQYGTTSGYGQATTPLTVTGTGSHKVFADLAGLTPATKYHYRILASNSAGAATGADRTFTTRRQPLGINFGALPNPVRFGGGTTLLGQVTGTGSGGANVTIQARQFPYVEPFRPVGNTLIADGEGRFSLPVLTVPFATQYRALVAGKSTSAIVGVSVVPRISTQVVTRVRRGARVTFHGLLTPALPGTPMAIQRRNSKGGWTLIGGMVSRTYSTTRSKYRKRVRITSTGIYRVYAGVSDGRFVPGTGREIRIVARR